MELKIAISVFLFLHALVGFQAVHGEETTSPATASVDVDGIPQSTRVTLGECRFGQTLHAALVIHNRSSTRLTIRAIDPDCGCLAVTPDRKAFEHGESIRLTLELAPAKKLANIRRAIRIFFDESSAPLVLHVDVKVVGPFELKTWQFAVGSTRQSLPIAGRKTEPGLTIVDLHSVRGAFRIEGELEQDRDGFRCMASPLFSFGSASDFVRVTYHDPSGDRHVVDLPVEFRVTDPIRFLPSTVSLTRHQGLWLGTARMILAPGNGPYDAKLMSVVVHGDEGKIDAEDCQVDVKRVSSVLCSVDIAVVDSCGGAIPKRLEINNETGQLLGTLYFSH